MSVSTRIALTASMALITGLTIGAATAARAGEEASVAFVQTNLVSNVAGRAKVPDPNLANAWGLAFPPGRTDSTDRVRGNCFYPGTTADADRRGP